MIRPIEIADTDFIIDSLYQLREESPAYNNYPADEDHTRSCIEGMINSPIFIGYTEPNKGFMLGAATSHWYSPELFAHEELLYVSAGYRGTSIAPRLIKAFVFEAGRRGCAEVLAGVSTELNEARTKELYRRMGFVDRGHLLVKELRSVHRT